MSNTLRNVSMAALLVVSASAFMPGQASALSMSECSANTRQPRRQIRLHRSGMISARHSAALMQALLRPRHPLQLRQPPRPQQQLLLRQQLQQLAAAPSCRTVLQAGRR